ncbi:MAG TPA: hypothetical protein VII99_00735, partial [Bacteroidia bacterium]
SILALIGCDGAVLLAISSNFYRTAVISCRLQENPIKDAADSMLSTHTRISRRFLTASIWGCSLYMGI